MKILRKIQISSAVLLLLQLYATEALVPAATLPAPDVPEAKMRWQVQLNANFTRLGLDNQTKNDEYKESFATALDIKYGGNNVTVLSLTMVGGGNEEALIVFEVEAMGTDPSDLVALRNKTATLIGFLADGTFQLLNVFGGTVTASAQAVISADVDVTPAVNKTFPFNFTVGKRS